MKLKKEEVFLGFAFIIAGIIFFSIGIMTCILKLDCSNKIRTMATITKIVSDVSDDDVYIAYISYKTGDAEHNTKLNSYSSSFYEGQKIEIYYNENNYDDVIVPSVDRYVILIPIVSFGVIILGISILVSRIKKNKNNFNLKLNGTKVYATYVSTNINMEISSRNKNPYNIICEWNDPSSLEKYVFKSNDIWYDPRNIIQEKNITIFPVYINKDNMKQYYVDVECLEKEENKC